MKRLLLSSVTTDYILVMHAYREGEQPGCTNQRSRLSPSISQVREALELGGPRNKEMGPHCLQPHPPAHAYSLSLSIFIGVKDLNKFL